YEPQALSREETAGDFDREFRRKVRIVNRAWRGLMSIRGLLNPFRHGLFAWQLLSHKLLRWLVPVLMLIALVTNGFLLGEHSIYRLAFGLQIAFYTLAGTGALLRRSRNLATIFYIPYYFCLVNAASVLGILEAYRGKTYTTWSTARAD